MQIDALELRARDLALNADDIAEKDRGWCTPRRFDEAGDMCTWTMKS